MNIDRNRQKTILEILANCYPDYSNDVLRSEYRKQDIANLYYLQEHGLIDASLDRTLDGGYSFQKAVITAKGLDFLANDGGLSAILGIVTIKIHPETIKELIQQHISESNLSTEHQNWINSKISTMSEEATKTITKSLVQQGLAKIPDLYKWAYEIFNTIS